MSFIKSILNKITYNRFGQIDTHISEVATNKIGVVVRGNFLEETLCGMYVSQYKLTIYGYVDPRSYFLLYLPISGKYCLILAIRVASEGCVLINSGVRPLFPADIFCQNVTAASGL